MQKLPKKRRNIRKGIDDKKRQVKQNSKCSKMRRGLLGEWKYVEEYCENSSIHGFRYFTNKDIHGFERIWWIISVILSMIGCFMLISDSYNKWDENPVIVTFSEKMIPVKDIAFPAVTICPEVKTHKEIFNLTAVLQKLDADKNSLSQEEYQLASALFQICQPEFLTDAYAMKEKTTNESVFHLIRSMAPKMADTFIECGFRKYITDCDYLFQEILTDEGLCFTFNALSFESMFYNGSNYEIMDMEFDPGAIGHWTLEEGYDDTVVDPTESYPSRVFTAGSKVGLTAMLSLREIDTDYICSGLGQGQGFKVILHSPNELPDINGKHFRIAVDEDVRVSIKPNILTTSNSLRDYSPERRQCYFNAERKLRFMKAYTQRNCQFECIANFTLVRCGCVRFSLPRDPWIPICGEANIICYHRADFEIWETAGINGDVMSQCDCLPACTSISYDAEISQAKYEIDKYLQQIYNSSEAEESLNGLKLARLSIFFKEHQFISSKRSEMFGMTDFVASCGGLLGLFMGISLLSIVELVYYFSLRVVCASRLKSSKIRQAIFIVNERKNGNRCNQQTQSKLLY